MNCIIILSSVTYALKGKKILESNGIYSELIKSGNLKEFHGCGYGLKVDGKNLDDANKLLREKEVKIIDIIGEEK